MCPEHVSGVCLIAIILQKHDQGQMTRNEGKMDGDCGLQKTEIRLIKIYSILEYMVLDYINIINVIILQISLRVGRHNSHTCLSLILTQTRQVNSPPFEALQTREEEENKAEPIQPYPRNGVEQLQSPNNAICH